MGWARVNPTWQPCDFQATVLDFHSAQSTVLDFYSAQATVIDLHSPVWFSLSPGNSLTFSLSPIYSPWFALSPGQSLWFESSPGNRVAFSWPQAKIFDFHPVQSLVSTQPRQQCDFHSARAKVFNLFRLIESFLEFYDFLSQVLLCCKRNEMGWGKGVMQVDGWVISVRWQHHCAPDTAPSFTWEYLVILGNTCQYLVILGNTL